jgi:hypothetical protein
MRRSLLPLAALSLLAFAVAQDDAEKPKDAWSARLVDTGRTHYLENIEGDDCIRCHTAIGEEWRETTHATAWIDEPYQKELKGVRRKKSCYGCHIPEPMSGQDDNGRPKPRSTNKHLGVHCTSCHIDTDGTTILGPFGIETDAHPTKKSERFDHDKDNSLCISCHKTTIGPVIGIAKDFVDTEQEEFGLSCVECHMPGLRRPIANREQGEEGEPYEVRSSTSHRLMTPRDPEFLRDAFILAAKKSGDTVTFSIENKIGHRVPGLLERKIHFACEIFDDVDDSIGKQKHTIDNRAFLPVEETHNIVIGEAKKAVRLVVKGTHEAPGARKAVTFFEKTYTFEQ